MELVITEKEDDVSVRYRCDICDYNPYQAWCKGNVARFHAALMKHKQSARHREAEAFARGEQPVSISKDGKVSADAPAERPPHFYISKLETMIDKLNDRIDALNHLYEGSETSEENNPEKFGSLVGDFRQNETFPKTQKSGDLVILVLDAVKPLTHYFKKKGQNPPTPTIHRHRLFFTAFLASVETIVAHNLPIGVELSVELSIGNSVFSAKC